MEQWLLLHRWVTQGGAALNGCQASLVDSLVATDYLVPPFHGLPGPVIIVEGSCLVGECKKPSNSLVLCHQIASLGVTTMFHPIGTGKWIFFNINYNLSYRLPLLLL